jgi:hypothetical protein
MEANIKQEELASCIPILYVSYWCDSIQDKHVYQLEHVDPNTREIVNTSRGLISETKLDKLVKIIAERRGRVLVGYEAIDNHKQCFWKILREL